MFNHLLFPPFIEGVGNCFDSIGRGERNDKTRVGMDMDGVTRRECDLGTRECQPISDRGLEDSQTSSEQGALHPLWIMLHLLSGHGL
jgi:hypothetical protein